MKRTDIRQLHDKTTAELQQQLSDLQKELARLRLERVAGKANLSTVRALSDDIARVKTVLRELQLQSVVEQAAELEAETK